MNKVVEVVSECVSWLSSIYLVVVGLFVLWFLWSVFGRILLDVFGGKSLTAQERSERNKKNFTKLHR